MCSVINLTIFTIFSFFFKSTESCFIAHPGAFQYFYIPTSDVFNLVLFHSNGLYFLYFMFQIRIWSVWEFPLFQKAHNFVFPGPFRSVPVFTNSNLEYIHVNSDDSKVQYLMFLLLFTSGPRFLFGYEVRM